MKRFIGRMKHWWRMNKIYKVKNSLEIILKIEELKLRINKAVAAGRNEEIDKLEAFKEALEWSIQEKKI